MKRVVIDPETNEVINVELIDETSPFTIDVDDDVRVGPGMLWTGSHDEPLFTVGPVEPVDEPPVDEIA